MDALRPDDERRRCGRRNRMVLASRRWCQVARRWASGDGG